MGYSRAGFDVTGVDLFKHKNTKGKTVGFSQKRYPFKSHQADAIEYVQEHGHEYDAIHASPPCQHASIATSSLDRSDYPRLIEPTREALISTGKPYVIENVTGSLLLDPLMLCGSMFGLTAFDDDGTPLRLERHRLFETNIQMWAPHYDYHDKRVQVAGSYGGARRDKDEARNVRHGGYVPSATVQQRLLGIDWMTEGGMHQSVPPAYTEWVGRELFNAVLFEKAPPVLRQVIM
jgi:DNA (cytosine-5)-methyltransferase 1